MDESRWGRIADLADEAWEIPLGQARGWLTADWLAVFRDGFVFWIAVPAVGFVLLHHTFQNWEGLSLVGAVIGLAGAAASAHVFMALVFLGFYLMAGLGLVFVGLVLRVVLLFRRASS